jgi:hypothetical protein
MHAAAEVPPVSTDDAEEEVTLLAWRAVRPSTGPAQFAAVLLGYAAALSLWWLLLPHPAALFVPVVALTGALREFLFPTDCRLTTKGAYVANGPARLFLAWGDVRRATHGADGVFLSPFARPSRLDQFRGVRLGFGGGNVEEVLAAVRRMRQTTPEERDGTA